MREYGISARLTFSNSLLRAEHLSDPKCNALCAQFAQTAVCRTASSSIRSCCWTICSALSGALSRVLHHQGADGFSAACSGTGPEFRYVVPDFRLNKAFEQLDSLPQAQKPRWSFSATSAAGSAAPSGSAATRRSAAKIWARTALSTAAPPRMRPEGYRFSKAMREPRVYRRWRHSGSAICPWAFRSSRSRDGGLAAHWCWNFCSII